MLEDGGLLLTWALAAPPQLGCDLEAEELAHHRLEYLDMEGPLSGNRGTVERTDAGEFEWLVREPDEVMIDLRGEALRGTAQLTRRDGQSWRFFLRDALS